MFLINLEDYFIEKLDKKIIENKKKDEIKNDNQEKEQNLNEEQDPEKIKKQNDLAKLGVFGIQRFLKTAKEEFDLKEGNWFRSTTFLMGLDYILNSNPNAIPGIDLKVYNMNDNIMFLKDVFAKIFDPEKGNTFKLGELSTLMENKKEEKKIEKQKINTNPNLCNSEVEESDSLNNLKILNDKQENFKEENKDFTQKSIEKDLFDNLNLQNTDKFPKKLSFSETESISYSHFDFETVDVYKEYLRNNETKRPLLLCLNTMLGLSEINKNHQDFLEALFELKCFVGMLGGREYKAFYFFGFDKNYFYYLDPHYVKSSHGREYNDEDYIRDYFSKNIFKTEFYKIAPSLSLCFLIQSSKGI